MCKHSIYLLSSFFMLQNDLVQVQKGEIFTTSSLIAEKLEAKHTDIIKTINFIIKNLDSSKSYLNNNLGVFAKTPKYEEKFIETTFKHWKTKIEFKWYLINESAFTILIMNLWRYKKAFDIQRIFTQQFFQMREALQNQSNSNWLEARKSWKQLRRLETDVLKELTEYAEKQTGKPIPYPLYSTYTQMTNKHLQFIIDTKEWKPIRDLLNVRDLFSIWIVDDRCKNAIIQGMSINLPYKDIYQYAKDEVAKIVDALDFKPRLPQPETQSSQSQI